VDIWSIGCVMAEMYTGKALFPWTGDIEHSEDGAEMIAQKMGIFNDDIWPGVSDFSKYFEELSAYPQQDITKFIPQIEDEHGKALLRSLLGIPSVKRDGSKMIVEPDVSRLYYPRNRAEAYLTNVWFDQRCKQLVNDIKRRWLSGTSG